MDLENVAVTFCIGHHESNRALPVDPSLVRLAQEKDYDVLTTPVTRPSFHSKVLALLSWYMSQAKKPSHDSTGTLETSQNSFPLVVPPLGPDDSDLTPHEATNQLIGVTSPWIDLCSPDPLVADVSRQVFAIEIAYAAFCGISFVMIPGPKLHHGALYADGLAYYARAVQEAISVAPYMQFNLWFHIIDHPNWETVNVGDLSAFARPEYLSDDNSSPVQPDIYGTWEAWDVIRKICKYPSRLFVALSLPQYLPPIHVQMRWRSEPVRILTLSKYSFTSNPKGYPVLSVNHQALIAEFMRLRAQPWLVLCNVDPIPGVKMLLSDSQYVESPTPAEAAKHFVAGANRKVDETPHLTYLRHLQNRQPPRTMMEQFGIGYQDYLQAPLQPLTVNLESITYEVFEKDPIKYAWYERAMAAALIDWKQQNKPTSGPRGRVVLSVVGAGRGPLVTRALNASTQTGVDIEVWLVEKNENAFVLLQRHNATTWHQRVNLVRSDMRSWKGPQHTPDVDGTAVHYPVDIIVSELLGSFGDNELSPECLDGVQHVLNPTHGISIPAVYSAHLTPISSPRLHADISAQIPTNPAAPETPYVVMLHAFDFLSTTSLADSVHAASDSGNDIPDSVLPQPLVKTAWSFTHPNPHANTGTSPNLVSASGVSNVHNARRTKMTFPCSGRGVCHGLGGYFEAILYPGIELSTNPVSMDTKSAGMISWFPIYFPLRTPLTVPENSEIVITMFRQTDDRKVWYEWLVEVFAPVQIDGLGRRGAATSGTDKSFAAVTTSTPRQLRRTRVAMSELHSSIKEGCLM